MKCSHGNCSFFFSNCWTFSAFTSSITKLLGCKKGGERWRGGKLEDTTATFTACINHQANKLKAKWLLALNIYHRGKPNEALYTLEDRGMLLFITVICGWIPCCWLKNTLSSSSIKHLRCISAHWNVLKILEPLKFYCGGCFTFYMRHIYFYFFYLFWKFDATCRY